MRVQVQRDSEIEKQKETVKEKLYDLLRTTETIGPESQCMKQRQKEEQGEVTLHYITLHSFCRCSYPERLRMQENVSAFT